MRGVPVSVDITIEQATAAWLARYASANTRAAYSSDLRAFLSWWGDDATAVDATLADLNMYRSERESMGMSAATVDRQMAALRAFYTTASELGACAVSPFGERSHPVAATSATAVLTPDELARLQAAAVDDPRTVVLVQLLLIEGMGLGEILALDHEHISGPRNARHVRLVRHRRTVDVVLDHDVSRSISALQRVTASPGPLFTGPGRGRAGSTRLTRFGADHLLKQAAAAAGIQCSVSANVLRRTHVRNAQRDGVAVDDIRRRMGHQDVRTTRRYLTPDTIHQHHPEGS